MSAIKSFLLAIEMATRQRDQANQGLMHVQKSYVFAQDQMNQLETYANETESRWTTAAQNSTSMEMLRHHYQFMGRLQHAMSLQQEVLASESRKMAQAKKVVLEAEFRLVSLKQVLEKKQAGLALVQARREQKQMDEFASQRRPQLSDEYSSGDRS